MLLDDGLVDSKLLAKVLDGCPTLSNKVNFVNALLLQPPCDQHREWIEAFGLSWSWTDIVCRAKTERDITIAVYGEAVFDADEQTIN